MHWLCAGVLAGGFLQMAVPAAVLIAEGWRPVFDLGITPRVREIAVLMTPGLFGTAIYQINISVSRLLAFSIDDASATYLFTVNRLMEFPIGVFAIAVSTVVYPLIARDAVQGNKDAMARDFLKGIRMILILNIPAAAGLALLSGPIVRLIYQHGRVTAHASQDMGYLLTLFAIGLPFFSVVSLTVRAFYAIKDTATPVRIAVIDFIINIVLSLSLIPYLGVVGLVMASTTAIIAQALLLERALARRFPGMSLAGLGGSVGKVLLGTAAMAAVVVGGGYLLGRTGLSGRGRDVVAVTVLIPAAVLIYASVLWRLKIEGLDELSAVITRFRGKLTAPATDSV
jgi:putative peptidoglycan lipid II flippase